MWNETPLCSERSQGIGSARIVLFAAALGSLVACSGVAAVGVDEGQQELHRIYVNGRVGYVDGTGKIAIQAEFDFSGGFAEGMASVRRNGKYGFIDTTGRLVVPFEYDFVRGFANGRAAVRLGTNEGYVSKTGIVSWLKEGDIGGNFSCELAPVKRDVLWGYVNKGLEFVLEPQFEAAEEFGDCLASVRKGGKEYYIDPRNHAVIERTGGRFYEGLAWFADEQQFGFIDREGRVVVQPRFDDIDPFQEGFAAVRLDDLWGFVDSTGKLRIRPRFSMVGAFANGLAAVKVGDKWGYIDPDGNEVIPPTYDRADECGKLLCPVVIGGERGLIDRRSRAWKWTPSE